MEAEAHALLFGAKLATALNLQDATLFTDKQVLAFAVLAGSPRTHPGHWSIHLIIAEIQNIIQVKGYTMYKIRRETNKIADSLAKKARRASILNSGLFSCQALAHHATCNIKLVLQNND